MKQNFLLLFWKCSCKKTMKWPPMGSHIQENRINFLRSILWLGSKVYHLIHIFSKNQLEIHVKRPLNSALKIMRGLLDVGLLLSSFQIAHGRTSPDIAMLFCGSCNQHKFYNDQKKRFTRIWASIKVNLCEQSPFCNPYLLHYELKSNIWY